MMSLRTLTIVALTLATLPLSAQLPKVVILGTGGTIQSKGDTRMTRFEYTAGRFQIDELVSALPEIGAIANVHAEQYTNIGSPSMTAEIWKGLATKINDMVAADPEIAGFVLTHGTNTLEETAYFLHLTVKTDRPVVLVGAQRPGTSISGDGPMNLYNAIRVAAHPDSRGKGVLICMNQQINSAREGTKTSAYKVQAFQSRDLGLLGVIDPDRVMYYRAPLRRHTYLSEFYVNELPDFPRVDVVASHAEASGDIIDHLVASGAKGIVIAGHGAGGASPSQYEAIKRATEKGVVVVAASRTGSGRVIASDERIASRGTLPGDNLLPHKARILLQLGLAKGLSFADLQRVFESY